MKTIKYWVDRYAVGGTSGMGSYNKFAEFKSKIINRILIDKKIDSMIDLGCGDGNQLTYYKLDENSAYYGYDVSDSLIQKLRLKYNGDNRYKFYLFSEIGSIPKCTLTMSIDVIYHLIEDVIYEEYMKYLFNQSNKYVLIYSSNMDLDCKNHMKHRMFTKYVEDNFKDFKLIEKIKNEITYITPDFYLYEKI